MPECDAILAHCVTYLAETKKSVRTYQAYELVSVFLADFKKESENFDIIGWRYLGAVH